MSPMGESCSAESCSDKSWFTESCFDEMCLGGSGRRRWRRSYDTEADKPVGMGRGNFPGGDRNSGSDAPHPCSVLAGTVWREISASGGDGRWVRAARRLDNGAHYPRHHFYDTGAAAIRPGYSRETLIVSSLVGEIVVRFRAGDWNFSTGHELHHEYWRTERNRGDHAV